MSMTVEFRNLSEYYAKELKTLYYPTIYSGTTPGNPPVGSDTPGVSALGHTIQDKINSISPNTTEEARYAELVQLEEQIAQKETIGPEDKKILDELADYRAGKGIK